MFTRQQIPNLLTFARVLAVPACLAIMLINPAWKNTALFIIFVVASVTDYLDGYLARKWNVESPVGALLDPMADKLLVALLFIYILVEGGGTTRPAFDSSLVAHSPLFVPITLILLRELYISGLREFLSNRQIKLPVSSGGKLKTAVQMVTVSTLVGLLAFQAAPSPLYCEAPFTAAFSNACIQGDTLIVRIFRPLALPMLYLSTLLALWSAVSYTKAAWKHVR
jgi:cardiolipin synthase (CMP-forming)